MRDNQEPSHPAPSPPLDGTASIRRDRCQAGQQLFTGRAWGRRRTRRKLTEDGLDPVVQRGVLIEDGGAVEQTDATDRAPEDRVVVRCSGQGAHEREERIAAVASADLQRRAAPAQRARRVGRADERVPLASFSTSVRPVALHDRVYIGSFSSGLGEPVRVGEWRTTGHTRAQDRCGRRRLRRR